MTETTRARSTILRVSQFEAKFYVDGLRFAPLRHYAIYAYLLKLRNHLNVYVLLRSHVCVMIKYGTLRNQKNRSRHIKFAKSTQPT